MKLIHRSKLDDLIGIASNNRKLFNKTINKLLLTEVNRQKAIPLISKERTKCKKIIQLKIKDIASSFFIIEKELNDIKSFCDEIEKALQKYY